MMFAVMVDRAARAAAFHWTTRVLAPAALLACATANAGTTLESGWYWENPLPQPNSLRWIAYPDSSHGFMVGDAGALLSSNDGGVTWVPQQTPVPSAGSFAHIRFIDATHAVASGVVYGTDGSVNGFVLHSDNGGATFTDPGPIPNALVYDVHFSDADNGIGIGLDFTTFDAIELSTTDGGATWTTSQLGFLGVATVLTFVSPTHGFLGGLDGVQSQGLIWQTLDGGATWSPTTIATGQTIYDIEFSDATHGFAAATGGELFATTDGGATWNTLSSGTSFDLQGIAFVGSDIFVAGGDYLDNGVLLQSSDGGATWSSQSFEHSISAITFTDAQTGTIGGFGGYILRTTDGGTTWHSLEQSVSTAGLASVAFIDTHNGTAVGENGTIVRTPDGGRDWQPQQSNTTLYLYGVAQTDSNFAIAVGGDITTFAHVIVVTNDAGGTWTDVTPPDLTTPLFSVACPAAGVCTAVGSCGVITHTDDAGANWTTQRAAACTSQLDLNSVAFTNTQTGIAVGQYNILRTDDGGTTWAALTSPTDQVLHGIVMRDANNLYVVGGHQVNRGLILHSTDGGATWNFQQDSLYDPIEAVAFGDDHHAVSVGLGGEIYRTNDGGDSWLYDTGVSGNLYGVAMPDAATAQTVGFASYNAAILGWSDRVFASGFDE